MKRIARLGRIRLTIIALCLLVIILAWAQITAARRGLDIHDRVQDGVPLRYIGPENGENVPGVVIAHGFSGSGQLMQTYAYTFAHNGYGVMLLDFSGHGANSSPLGDFGSTASLDNDLAVAVASLSAETGVSADPPALLGHSMGSGIVMRAGVDTPERFSAVIAVSPTGAAVDAEKPPNLLLQAGQLEAPFADRARVLLAQAGGVSADFSRGTARDLTIIPFVEHISILFSPGSLNSALDWLDASFDRQSPGSYRETRMVWWLAQLGAWLILAVALAPTFPHILRNPDAIRPPRHWLGLVAAPFAASLGLFLLSQLMDMSTLGGVTIAGALALWFLLFGGLWLGIGFRPKRLTIPALLWGIALFGFYWLAFGLPAHVVWLPWLLIPARLLRWPLLLLAYVPWQLAAGMAQQGARWTRRIGWWLGQSACILAGLLVAMAIVPGLGFLILLMPLIPIVLGIMSLLGGIVDRPWAIAIGNAAFFAWLTLALFPLAN
ncbi:MAG: lysophospholipase [Anaerolineae bacterium]|nr:lysophospholipase [Anaerolineae bacterium]